MEDLLLKPEKSESNISLFIIYELTISNLYFLLYESEIFRITPRYTRACHLLYTALRRQRFNVLNIGRCANFCYNKKKKQN